MELTQEQFAAELGVVYPTVNRWENGHAQPSPLALKKIEEMLQIMGDRGQYLMAKHFGDRE
jgi:DNA-binding transcriptional regulator YiaG